MRMPEGRLEMYSCHGHLYLLHISYTNRNETVTEAVKQMDFCLKSKMGSMPAIVCPCNNTCCHKDGPKQKGCPCKTAGQYCADACSCNKPGKQCKNRQAATVLSQGWQSVQGPLRQPDDGLTEEQERDEQNRRVKAIVCPCNNTCCHKDGPKQKGCPCKTAGQYCADACSCNKPGKQCKNRQAATVLSQGWQSVQGPLRQPDDGLTEEQERDEQNRRVKAIVCPCNNTCCHKDGPKQKGCPCKTAGQYCADACSCNKPGKQCKNRQAATVLSQGWQSVQGPLRQPDDGLTEEQERDEQNRRVKAIVCPCNNTCCHKDGPKQKGCPCKTAGQYCADACSCNKPGKQCKNRQAATVLSQGWQSVQGPLRQPDDGLTEEQERDEQNRRVKAIVCPCNNTCCHKDGPKQKGCPCKTAGQYCADACSCNKPGKQCKNRQAATVLSQGWQSVQGPLRQPDDGLTEEQERDEQNRRVKAIVCPCNNTCCHKDGPKQKGCPCKTAGQYCADACSCNKPGKQCKNRQAATVLSQGWQSVQGPLRQPDDGLTEEQERDEQNRRVKAIVCPCNNTCCHKDGPKQKGCPCKTAGQYCADACSCNKPGKQCKNRQAATVLSQGWQSVQGPLRQPDDGLTEEQERDEQNRRVKAIVCPCNNTCCHKDGPKQKGCPCKTAGQYCADACSCNKPGKQCKNRQAATVLSQGWQSVQGPLRQPDDGLTEEQERDEQNRRVKAIVCPCNNTCCHKDGPKQKGCPCKTAGQYCADACSCNKPGKQCKNRQAATVLSQGWQSVQGPLRQPDDGLTEEQERDEQNRRVKDIVCPCNNTCCHKDGPKRKGCPCKTAGQYCTYACSCNKPGKQCKNRQFYPSRPRPSQQARYMI
ncbi:multiple epidermal growth factor-like domains protein 10 isoform X2 [Acropora muricata]|uniref:multiple epidermal growth factor-like domains protein 10 isoform X2 n=1 Tax=Acropora muricata TaxID=159855 RepID=UPI0034E4C61E